MMPRAGTPETKSPPRPRIGFSIDFLVGNNKRKSPPSSDEPEALLAKSAKTDKDPDATSPPQSSTPDSSRSGSPHGDEARRLADAPGAPGSPLFQSWSPASVISAGHPAGYLDMAALANLRQLYEQQQQQPTTRPGFFPAPHPAGFPIPPGPPGGPMVPGAPLVRPAGDPSSSLAAQQWWLLAQARQHQQRLFAAAAVANRFPPGKSARRPSALGESARVT